MKACKINISSKGNGWRDYKSVRGEISEEDGVVAFKYSLDGDACILTVKDGTAVQEREGAQCVKITFREGERTQCVIRSGGLSGSYTVYTKSFKFVSGKGGNKLSLEYENGADGELIKLDFTAVKILI